MSAPKLSRVLETRRTAEAEELLSALRTEQEKRCVLGKNYTADAAKVPVMASSARIRTCRPFEPVKRMSDVFMTENGVFFGGRNGRVLKNKSSLTRSFGFDTI